MPAPESPSVPVTVAVQDGVARVSLDRPPLNVLDIDMLRQLNDALRQCDRTSIRVVLLASALPRAFSAGVDVGDHAVDRIGAMLTEVRENARLLLNLAPVTLAAINGSTLGGGAEIALLCDLVMAADDTVFGFPEAKLAAFPPVAVACLPELGIGPRAMRLLLGEPIDARAAYDAGLVSHVVPANELVDAVDRLAMQLAALSSVALRALTASSRRQRATAILQRLDAAIEIYRTDIAPTHDAQEGIRAFKEKRAPVWRHR
ncbi:MAG: enoyl-CoA hydratase-related protein [Candidatus Dormibacteraeota bacterium]|nr:enoyl-CoA hydratase-related protein [Candidatus Dormibacteraeota bacterium]